MSIRKEADIMDKTDTTIVHSPQSSKLKSDGFGITFTKGTLKDHFESRLLILTNILIG